MNKILIILTIIFITKLTYAEPLSDQWVNSEKTYKDLIKEGFEIKAYDTNTISAEGNLTILLFITVLQKKDKVFECQEYQTLDKNMETLDMSLICKELVKPYIRGLGA
jgi:hypothetical protein